MGLHFPNQIRRYDAARDCVCFWGSDSAFEVAFQVDTAALRHMDLSAGQDEVSMLRAFDGNLAKILKAASTAYSRKRQSYYRLLTTDF
ncbi:DUF1488 family protein [Bosea sp. (in: a-proteobacteria)]|jgi:hypothetical protein|uniref:DUF1488 family protein n=1 Tax=Bosea sp. (in: a-proteobacteria) TaxID=1871050 RepID=UPI003F70C486